MMKNSPALDKPLRSEAEARAELGEPPISDAELEELRRLSKSEQNQTSMQSVSALIARLDAAEAERDRLKADVAELCESGKNLLHFMSLGPLNAATAYGPDFDLRAAEIEAAEKFSAFIAKHGGGES